MKRTEQTIIPSAIPSFIKLYLNNSLVDQYTINDSPKKLKLNTNILNFHRVTAVPNSDVLINIPAIQNINITAHHCPVICGYNSSAPNGGYNFAISIAKIAFIKKWFVS